MTIFFSSDKVKLRLKLILKFMKLDRIVKFFLEVAVLKKTPRVGWRNIGMKNGDSVAEHSFLASQIAFVLGKMEKVNAERSALIALFHDNGEARVGDRDLINETYLNSKKAEENAFFDQIKGIIGEKEIKDLYQEWIEQKTPEAIVAKDADLLELIIEAKSQMERGNKLVKVWIDNAKSKLKTKSAKKIAEKIEKTEIDSWWRQIPKIKEKLNKLKKT